jgi:predicted nucleic acid-binding protein
VTAKEQL